MKSKIISHDSCGGKSGDFNDPDVDFWEVADNPFEELT